MSRVAGYTVTTRALTVYGGLVGQEFCDASTPVCCGPGPGSGSGPGSGPRPPGGPGGGGPVTVPCCANSLPADLFLTFSGGTGALACLNGLTYRLTWGGASWLNAAASGCGNAFTVMEFACSAGNIWTLSLAGCANALSGGSAPVCSPFSVSGSEPVANGTCGAGGLSWTVTL